MSRAARAFYFRYHVLTQLLPGYLLAAVAYFHVLLIPRSAPSPLSLAGLSEGWLLYSWLFGLVLACLEPTVRGLGFALTLVARRAADPAPQDLARLREVYTAAAALAPLPELSRLRVHVAELGDAPYLAVSGDRPPELWLSTHTLHHTPPADLAVLLHHELGHLAEAGGPRPAWWQQDPPRWFWLAAPPLAWHLAGAPLLLLLALAVQVALWVRLHAWNTALCEAVADKRAAGRVGRERYALALARHLRQFEQPARDGQVGTQLRRARLRGMGLSDSLVAGAIRQSEPG